MKIYKKRNPNRRKVGVLFFLQIVFGMLPAVLLLFFVFNIAPNSDTNQVGAYISAAAIVLCAFAYMILGRKYNILLSGLKGEKSMLKTVKHFKHEYDIFVNVPIRYKRNRSELDLLMVGERGIIIVEVKNHSGVINGSDGDDTWCQFKHYRDGKNTETEIKNPVKQVSRQRDILKNILRSEGIDVWIDGVVYFSNPFTKLKLQLNNPNSNVCLGEKELRQYISDYRGPKKLKKAEIERIREILVSLM